MKQQKLLKTAFNLSLVVALTACGQVSPMSRYAPLVQPPAPTTTVNNLPKIFVSENKPTLPDGKLAVSMSFDMDAELEKQATPATTTKDAKDSKDSKTTDATAEKDTQTTAPEATAATPSTQETKVTLGSTKNFSVKITLDDGQVLNKFTNVNWVSTNPEIGTINRSGAFTPVREGTTKVIASIGGVAATINVVVAPGNYIWQQIQAPTQANLNAVKIINDTEAWAVGSGGTVLHFLRGTWYNLTQQILPMTGGANLYGIDMLNNYDGWIVGDNVILHLENGRWVKMPVPVNGTFRSIDMQIVQAGDPLNSGFGGINPYGNTSMFNPGGSPAYMPITGPTGWIVGENGDTSIALRFDGRTGWQPFATGVDHPLYSVSSVGPRQAWAAGGSSRFTRPGIYQFDGESWTKVKYTNSLIDFNKPTGKYTMKSIKMLNTTQGWAVGEYDPLLSSLRGKRGAMFSFNSVKNIWEEVKFDAKVDKRYEQVTFNTVGMLAANKGWVLGTTITAALDLSVNPEINGNLIQTDGNKMTPATDYQSRSLSPSFNSIDLLEHGNGIIVGDNGLIMHRQYDQNYRYQQGNFSNFNGQAGSGYLPGVNTAPQQY